MQISNVTIVNAQGTSQTVTSPGEKTYEELLEMYNYPISNVDVSIIDETGSMAELDDYVTDGARVTINSRKVKSGI